MCYIKLFREKKLQNLAWCGLNLPFLLPALTHLQTESGFPSVKKKKKHAPLCARAYPITFFRLRPNETKKKWGKMINHTLKKRKEKSSSVHATDFGFVLSDYLGP